MQIVYPIKDKKTIQDIADYLKIKNERDYIMFMIGIHTGLRISDIRMLRVRDLRGKTHFNIKAQQKTAKPLRLPISKELKDKIDHYIKNKAEYEYILKSRKGFNNPISYQQAYNILNGAGSLFGVENIGTHTMRKTFGYFLYLNTKDIVLVKETLSHSSIDITRRYIGLVQGDIEKAVSNLSFGI